MEPVETVVMMMQSFSNLSFSPHATCAVFISIISDFNVWIISITKKLGSWWGLDLDIDSSLSLVDTGKNSDSSLTPGK